MLLKKVCSILVRGELVVNKKIKLIIAFVFIIFTYFSFNIATQAVSVWDGSVSSTAPSQTSDGFYNIKNGSELAWVSKQVEAGYTNLKIKLANDIYLNNIELEEYTNKWTPIGSKEIKYQGYFDGNNHIIYGLYIDTTEQYQGLFGYLYNAKIKNLKLYNCKINADKYVGGICGFAQKETVISDCVVSGEINNPSGDCGGISGYSNNFVTISSSTFRGTITSQGNRIGGITGCIVSNTVVESCYNSGIIASSGKFVGGIVGTSSGSKVTSCYNLGDVSGLNRVGGIVGNNVGNVYVSYNCGIITSDKDKGAVCGYNTIAEVENCYYLDGTCDSGDEFAIVKTTLDMKRYSFIVSLNKNGGNFILDYQEENNGFPILSWQLESDVWTLGVKKPDIYIDGESYMITNGEELAWFAGLVNGTLDDTPQNQYAKAILMKSILLNIGAFNEEVFNVWTPIGSNGAEFFGYFDGNGKTVSGIYVPEGEASGLFGSIRTGATVKNLKITDSNICGTKAGGLAGSNLGDISSIKVFNTQIIATSMGGGIVGENEGTLNSCSFAKSTVESDTNCGGITGYNSGSVISCYCVSDVSALSYVGGICGINDGTIEKSFNSGNITTENNYAGGICGSSNYADIFNCYNRGKIKGASYVGGITGFSRYGSVSECYDVGEVESEGLHGAICGNVVSTTISNVYYDSERIDATDSNATALKTAEMTSNTAFSSMTGFSRINWTTMADSQYFTYYPQIIDFSSSGDFEFVDDSLDSVEYLKHEYNCRVDIDEIDTYYSSIKDAADFIGKEKANIYIFKDMTVGEEAVINGNITIVPENKDITVKRDENYDGYFFKVEGTLNIGDKKYENAIKFDGSTSDQSMNNSIVYVYGGTFNLVKGALCNNNSVVGGAIYNSGTTNLYSGEIYGCKTISNGGAIYNGGILNVEGVEIHDNLSFENGGAIYSDLNGAVSNIISGKIYNNNANCGGAIYSQKGIFEITGAEIYSNSANNGGAIYTNGGTVNFLGGSIYNNNADVGKAVYNNTTFNMGDSGFIDNNNDVYLPDGKTVNMISKINSNNVSLNITPEKYEKNVRVISGTYCAANFRRVAINDYQTQNWHINSSGYLLTDEVVEVALVSILGAHSVYYTSLEEAFADIGSNDAIITLVDDIKVSETLNVISHITILSDGNNRSIFSSDELDGPVFVVKENCSLILGDNVNEEENDLIYLDASANENSSYIIIEENATLNIYNGAVINNGKSQTNAAIKNNGTISMYGGKIIDNSSQKGAVENTLTGKFNMYAGTFSNNHVSIYNNGELNLHENAAFGDETVLLCEGKTINISEDYTGTGKIAVIECEKYNLNSALVETTLDKTGFVELFSIKDESYFLDSELKLCATKFILKSTSSLCYDSENKYITGVETDINKAGNIISQFENSNIKIFDLNNNELSETDVVATKYMVALVDSNNDIYDYAYILIYGDVNSDGFIDAEDAVLISFMHYNYITIDDDCIKEAADVNHDGVVDLSDSWIVEDVGLFMGTISQKVGG